MILKIICAWFVLWSVAAFIAMGADKSRARRGAWRIPEATLFLLTLLGGALGATLGMHIFHHKTRHWYFRLGFPLILLVQLALVVFLSWKLGLGFQ